jgi:hypothetical protein
MRPVDEEVASIEVCARDVMAITRIYFLM